MKIYLADLVYDTVKTNYVVPLNIAYIASYLQQKYYNEVEITLFKYPKSLLEAIKSSPPDILGLSHYSWNSRLNRFFLDISKVVNPKTITVMGGPNIRTDRNSIEAFLRKNPKLDYYIIYEGEEPFADLVGNLLKSNHKSKFSGGAAIIEGEFIYETHMPTYRHKRG